ncbi:S9 family peptidase [Actinacidiphila alni]|uniref:S9 family peptidase n=1 Tax=Actinacidiphila alni TaxID=380248 RepID=UPI00345396EF
MGFVEGFPEQLVRTRGFGLGVPGGFVVGPGGRTVVYGRSRDGDDPAGGLWALDVEEGRERLLARWDGAGAYAADRAVRRVALVVGGELWTVEVSGGRARRLAAREPVSEACPDPSGARIAYISGGDSLRVIEWDGTGDRPVAEPAPGEEAVGFGTAGFWWAPDGARLLVAREDTAAVPLWYVADPAEPAARPRAVRYAAAGGPLPEVTLWITGTDAAVGATEVRWDHGAFAYLADAGWDAHGPYATVRSRDQRTVRMLAVDTADGRTHALCEQRDACWVQPVPGLPARARDGALLAHADLRGTRHLTVNGVPVTPPGLQLRALLSADDDEILFSASEDPTETHLWTYAPATGLTRLTTEPGVHDGVRRGGTLVHLSGGHAAVRRQAADADPVPIESRAETPVLELRTTSLVLGPRDIRATLHLPSWYEQGHEPSSEQRLPVLLDPYGGAARQRVTAEPDWRALVAQWFAEQGFAVLVADGRGTPGRGPEWERAVHGDLFGPVLEDQITALHEAAALHDALDLTRVAIRGWSFGGALAMLAVLRRPDVFHAAVAGAAVTDSLLYHAEWRERFLGHPDLYPERYEDASPIREASALTRPLLLAHGLLDDNVHPAHTLRMSAALLAAGRPHEVLLLPGVGHRPFTVPGGDQLLRHQAEFLHRHLGAQ